MSEDLPQAVQTWLERRDHWQQHWPDYQLRPAQLQLAQRMAMAIEQRQSLLVEAANGTGKSLAYLLPAWLQGERVLIATSTKILQTQLWQREFPLLSQVLGHRPVAMLQGRESYPCWSQLRWLLSLANRLPTEVQRQLLQVQENVRHWQVKDAPDQLRQGVDEATWQTLNASECQLQSCNETQCPWYQARHQARQAELVLTNQALLLAEPQLLDDLQIQVCIVDEAHRWPEQMASSQVQRLSSRDCIRRLRELRWRLADHGQGERDLLDRLHAVEQALARLGRVLYSLSSCHNWAQALQQKPVLGVLTQQLQLQLDAIVEPLQRLPERHQSFLALAQFWRQQAEFWHNFQPQHPLEQLADLHFRVQKSGFECLASLLSHAAPEADSTPPLDQRSWIFISATLSINGDFQPIARLLPERAYQSYQAPLPETCSQQRLIYIPALPTPVESTHTAALIQQVLQLQEHLDGRILLLCTSWRALESLHQGLRHRLSMPLLRQDQLPINRLLKRFARHRQGLLLATGSYWEGVDFSPGFLQCVMIDRLPFMAPDDERLLYQQQLLRRQSKGAEADLFSAWQLPQAIIRLRQGVGRLFRHANSPGLVVIGDSRIDRMAYGAQFVTSLQAGLPGVELTRQASRVQRFCRETLHGND